VTEEQLLAALQAAREGSSVEGWTRREIESILGVREDQARENIRKLIDQGLMEFSGKRALFAMDGKRILVPVYRLTGR
jgi:Mn-dependent DtxR family transcriptional regulator